MRIWYRRLEEVVSISVETLCLSFVLTNRNVIVIIYRDEIAQLQMTRGTSSFTGNAFHRAAIPEKAVRMVVHQLESWLVECRSGMSLCYSKTYCI